MSVAAGPCSVFMLGADFSAVLCFQGGSCCGAGDWGGDGGKPLNHRFSHLVFSGAAMGGFKGLLGWAEPGMCLLPLAVPKRQVKHPLLCLSCSNVNLTRGLCVAAMARRT